MSHIGISAVRWNAARTEIEECLVHTLDRDGNEFAAGVGVPQPFYEVAARVEAGDTVWVLVKDSGSDRYDRSDKVRVRVGQRGYLESFTDSSKEATHSLFHLPEF